MFTLTVTTDTGATVTISKGSETQEKVATDGTAVFESLGSGTWHIVSQHGTASQEADVNLETEISVNLPTVGIFGIQRDITSSSPEWTRTDDSANFTATASVGTIAGSSDFDNYLPWSGIVRENIGSDVMVKIPKFWAKRWREGNIEHIQIANGAAEGFEVHPAFTHNDEVQDYIYVGAYLTSGIDACVSGAAPTTTGTRGNMREYARAKGTGWGLFDISTYSAIQMLYLVEYATNDSQTAIGDGITNSTSMQNTGSCDNVPNLTGRPAGDSEKVNVVYRGIEGLWGNMWEYIDGLLVDGDIYKYYICNDQALYGEGTTAMYNYDQLNFNAYAGTIYISRQGLDENFPLYTLPDFTGPAGSSSTYYCDEWEGGRNGWKIYIEGGAYNRGKDAGLFCASILLSESQTGSGSRLIYVPTMGG